MTADRKYFESRKNRDGLSFKEVFHKVFGSSSKIDVSEFKISDSKKMVVGANYDSESK